MVDAGGVVNTVSVEGYNVDEQLTADGSSPEVLIAAAPSFTVTKGSDVVHVGSDDASAPVVRAEDMIDYVITITNTGNVTLTNLVVKDLLTDGAGNSLDLRTSPGTGDLSQWTIASLAPDEEIILSERLLRSQAASATQLESQRRFQMVQRLQLAANQK
jgi:uncharacterized repeat protein (TIGR01451 family)